VEKLSEKPEGRGLNFLTHTVLWSPCSLWNTIHHRMAQAISILSSKQSLLICCWLPEARHLPVPPHNQYILSLNHSVFQAFTLIYTRYLLSYDITKFNYSHHFTAQCHVFFFTRNASLPHNTILIVIGHIALLLHPGRWPEYCDDRVSVCVFVWLFVCVDISGSTWTIFTKFLCMSHVVVAQSSSISIVIHYVFPVLWMISRVPVMGHVAASMWCSSFPAERGHILCYALQCGK